MLRELKEFFGFGLETPEGVFGKVHDFYFDDWVWTIRYVVADTGKWLPGRLVLISPMALLQPIKWNKQLLRVNLAREQIQKSPSIESDEPVSRQKEK